MILENVVEKGELLDCYGALLTKRQRDCLDLYYNENLTLAEIADYFHISRQAVHDAMRHGEEQLLLYEEALRLAHRRHDRQEAVKQVLDVVPEDIRDKVRLLLDGFSD